MRTRFPSLLACLFLLPSLCAQDLQSRIAADVRTGDTSQLHQLILLDYSSFRGTVTDLGPDTIRMQLRGVPGRLAIPTDQLRYLSRIDAEAAAGEPASMVTTNRVPLSDLTLVRTALPYQRGMRLKTVMLIYNTLEWNLNRHFQVSLGVAAPVGIILSQRYRTSLTDWLHVGLSNEFIMVPVVLFFESQLPYAGDLTTLMTIGDDQQFFSLGAGLFYTNETSSASNFRVGAGTRLGEATHLYGELVTTTNERGTVVLLPSLNVSLARRRHRWSFGLFSAYTSEIGTALPPLPYLSYSLYY